jgi:hypothetical protein
MNRDPSYSPFAGPRPVQQAARAETLWTLLKERETRSATLRQEDGAGGVDLQLFANGGFFVSRRFSHLELALDEAARWQRKYEAEGWRISFQD